MSEAEIDRWTRKINCLFLYKNHDKTELFQLEMPERNIFLKEMSIVAEATSKVFVAEKMYSDDSRPSEQVLIKIKK